MYTYLHIYIYIYIYIYISHCIYVAYNIYCYRQIIENVMYTLNCAAYLQSALYIK